MFWRTNAGDSSAEARRRQMVERQLAARGVRDSRVLAAFAEVPRERFVPAALRERAYDDAALPIGAEQTISQPYVVAVACEALELTPDARVLEIGAGSGYGAAILGRLAREVIALERVRELAQRATETLRALDVGNVRVIHADGARGFAEGAPYDAISVAAAAAEVPEALLGQLAPGGRLVMPVGEVNGNQSLVCVQRIERPEGVVFIERELLAVRFVPLVAERDPNGGAGREA